MNEGSASRVAVVTGASRGGGRAIAVALGELGYTVYVTGRSSVDGRATENLPGTVEETAAQVTAAGGGGVAVRVDHTVDADVAGLFARVRSEQGRLDLLVNNVWGGYEGYFEADFDAAFWRQPLSRWPAMFDAGVRAHFTASAHAALMFTEQRSGLLISTVAWAFGEYMGNVLYDSAKAATVRMIFGMAQELRPYDVAAIAVAPGFMRTERVMAAHARSPFGMSGTESPAYLGRAIAALAQDDRVLARTGQLLTVGELAREYGFTDVDGTQPPPFRIVADAEASR